MKYRIVFFLVTMLAGSSASIRAATQIPVDQVPMYGGMDRGAISELKAADEKLIADTSRRYGTREKASAAFVGNGFSYYQRNDLANAMRRFNQAWLLDPKNAESFAGFGSVLHDQGKNCEAMQLFEKALALNPPTFQGIYPDAARIVTLCAVSDKTLSAEAKAKLLERSEALYKKSEEIEPDKQYLYGSWATAYYWREQYGEAWAMVTKERAAGGKPGEKFLGLLRAKMPEPTQ